MSYDNDDDVDDEAAPSFSPGDWQANVIEQSLQPKGLPVRESTELRRILNIQRRPIVKEGTATAEALVELAQRRYSLGPRACRCLEIDRDRGCITRLLWTQAWGLHEIATAGGLEASMAIGSGKTNLWLLAPLALRDCRLALLLIPSSLKDQIIDDYRLLAEHFRVPGLVVHLNANKTWKRDAQPRPAAFGGGSEPMLHVLPYSRLSSIKSSDWIDRIQPDVIIADEQDALASVTSARTLRLLRYFENHPNARFIGGTGSMLDSSIKEVAHLSALALWRTGSPMPVIRDDIDQWSQALDAVTNPCPLGALTRLLNPGEPDDLTTVRRAFRRRLAETPGFVMVEGRQTITTPDGKKVEIDVRERRAPAIPEIVQKALDLARDFRRPDSLVSNREDWIIFDKLEQARCVREVASGMFYKWEFNPIEGVPQEDATIGAWYAARKEFNSELRRKMLKGEEHLDSPMLCVYAAQRAWGDIPKNPNLPEWKAESWPPWRDIEDKVVPTPVAVRLHSYLVDDAVAWAIENPGIVWYAMKEFAEWMRERALELHGVRLNVYGEGSGSNILNEDGSKSCIASIKSHGRGRNKLQYRYHRQLLAQSPASSRWWQQILGRLWRRGQKHELVEALVYLHTKELEQSFEQALRRGEFVEDVTGGGLELNYAWGQGRDLDPDEEPGDLDED